MELRSDTGTELVQGVVRNDSGLPVRDATIEAVSIPGPQSSSRGRRFTSTDADGRFQLSLASDGVWSVRAGREHQVDRRTWRHGAGSLELRLRPTASLVITRPPTGSSVVLVPPDGSSESSDRIGIGGLKLWNLVPGDYRVFLRSKDPAVFASADVHLEPGEQRELDLEVHPVQWIAARVESESGDCNGLELLLDAPGWPPALRSWWGRAWTSSTGKCELCLGDARTDVLHVLRDGTDLGTFPVSASAVNVFRVP